MKNTLISWCHHTVNFWWGCTKVSPACWRCYAETLAKLFSHGRASWGPEGLRWLRPEAASRELLALDASARRRGVVERVFINSMSDTFEDRRDLDEPRAALFALATGLTNLQLLLLTKRPERINELVPPAWLAPDGWPAHVWAGATAENQFYADQRAGELVRVPAAVRFLSCEPLLADFRLPFLTRHLDAWGNVRTGAGIHWVIVGGESGGGARPMELAWPRSLVAQCAAAGVACFVKQLGGTRDKRERMEEFPEELRVRQFPPLPRLNRQDFSETDALARASCGVE